MNGNELSLPYLAGFFDGEGCVRVNRTIARGCLRHDVLVQITSTDKAIVDYLQERFGGFVGEVNKHGEGKPWKRAYGWTLASHQAATFLRTIRPYIFLKTQQVWLALECLAAKTDYRGRKLTPEEIALRDGFWLALKAAKQISRDVA